MDEYPTKVYSIKHTLKADILKINSRESIYKKETQAEILQKFSRGKIYKQSLQTKCCKVLKRFNL